MSGVRPKHGSVQNTELCGTTIHCLPHLFVCCGGFPISPLRAGCSITSCSTEEEDEEQEEEDSGEDEAAVQWRVQGRGAGRGGATWSSLTIREGGVNLKDCHGWGCGWMSDPVLNTVWLSGKGGGANSKLEKIYIVS